MRICECELVCFVVAILGTVNDLLRCCSVGVRLRVPFYLRFSSLRSSSPLDYAVCSSVWHYSMGHHAFALLVCEVMSSGGRAPLMVVVVAI